MDEYDMMSQMVDPVVGRGRTLKDLAWIAKDLDVESEEYQLVISYMKTIVGSVQLSAQQQEANVFTLHDGGNA